VKTRVRSDKKGVELGTGVKMSMNPFDEIAIEEATRLKEKGIVKEIVAVSIGPQQSQETLRTAMAIGADKGIHVTTDMKTDFELQPLAVAKVLSKVVDQVKPDLVIVGKQSIDGDKNQTGQMLAGLLNWSQATFASKVEVADKTLQLTREVDSGLQTLSVPLPAVITTDLRLNEPRFATLPNIMKARKKPIETMALSSFEGVDVTPRLEVVSVEEPPARAAGIKVGSVEELVDKLKNVAKVL